MSIKGIGQSIRDVYFSAEKENVIWVPGDGQFDLKELTPFVNFSSNEFICFYRLENSIYSIFRNYLSLFNKKLNYYLLGISLKDVNWVKAYKTKLLQQLDLKMQSSIIETEICAKLIFLGAKPLETKSKYLDRTYGKSKGASFSTIAKVLQELLFLLLAFYKFKATTPILNFENEIGK